MLILGLSNAYTQRALREHSRVSCSTEGGLGLLMCEFCARATVLGDARARAGGQRADNPGRTWFQRAAADSGSRWRARSHRLPSLRRKLNDEGVAVLLRRREAQDLLEAHCILGMQCASACGTATAREADN